jgi:hypothetical protein
VCVNGFSSEWKPVPAGIPQGSVLGPTIFLLMVNALAYRESWRWKYMDDLTISETLHIVNNLCSSNLQQSSNDICEFVHEKKMMLNPVKCKEMFVCFKRVPPVIDNITINNVPIERVSTYKLLGVNLSSNLKWNEHVNLITKKAAKRIYSVRLLKRAALQIRTWSLSTQRA